MPSYCYFCATCGQLDEQILPIRKAKFRPACKCGERMERDIAREQSVRAEVRCSNWPQMSDAMAVHPMDIPAAEASAKAGGVPTSFAKDGRPIFTGPKHRKQYCEMEGSYDKDGGYGDPQRR